MQKIFVFLHIRIYLSKEALWASHVSPFPYLHALSLQLPSEVPDLERWFLRIRGPHESDLSKVPLRLATTATDSTVPLLTVPIPAVTFALFWPTKFYFADQLAKTHDSHLVRAAAFVLLSQQVGKTLQAIIIP